MHHVGDLPWYHMFCGVRDPRADPGVDAAGENVNFGSVLAEAVRKAAEEAHRCGSEPTRLGPTGEIYVCSRGNRRADIFAADAKPTEPGVVVHFVANAATGMAGVPADPVYEFSRMFPGGI